MQTNLWIARSQRFYRWLLRLYPQAHREIYEAEMFRMFTSQCQAAYKQRGKTGILSLWPRTLFDLGVTVVHEHLIDPQARLGLLEANPNVPLPWKGVFLVLIPGLIFFVSQIVQVTSTNDWFFIVSYRAGYFLMIPVLLVWLISRQFPIWGLIPLGLLYKSLAAYNPSYVLSRFPVLNHLNIFGNLRWGPFNAVFASGYFLPISGAIVLLGILIGYNVHHQQISRMAWKCLTLYALLIAMQIAYVLYNTVGLQANWQGLDWQAVIRSAEVQQDLIQIPFWYAYQPILLILLVFIGTLFARKHRELSFLLLLGYLLPTIIFGRYGDWTDALPFYVVSGAVLLYRFVIAVVAPVCLVRAVSMPRRKLAATIPVMIAVTCHLLLSLLDAFAMASAGNYSVTALEMLHYIWHQLITAAGLGLAVTLYLPSHQETVPPPILTTATK